ncbi:MAG: radical SAM protein [Patescibacteria group bacterium]
MINDFRVLMLYPNYQHEMMVPPALALFSSLLKWEGFKVDLFDTTNYKIDTGGVDSEKSKMANLTVRPFKSTTLIKKDDVYTDFRQKINSFSPDLLLVTATENMFLVAMKLLNSVEDTGVPVVLGGVFATFAPDLAMRWREVDMLCVGEGEQVIVELCRRMNRGEDSSSIPGLWVRGKDGLIKKNPLGPRVNMDENPLPDFTLFEDSRFYRPMAGKILRIFPAETHRGCPFTCAFCNSPDQDRLYGQATGQKFFRKKRFDKIHEELLFCRDVWRAQYIFFWADTFFAWSEEEFDQFCEMYADIKLPFWCQTRPETVVERRIKKLKDVGIHRMGFGIEHGNFQFRKDVVDRRYTNELVIARMRILVEQGVEFSVNNIIGFPDETRELSFDTIELNRHIPSDTMSCSIFVPFHGTRLRELCVEKGYIHPDVICPTNSDDTVLIMPPPFMSKEQMKGLRRVFAMYVKFPKERWPEIRQAEELTPEGDEVWEKLRKEFVKTFFAPPETDIEKINNAV